MKPMSFLTTLLVVFAMTVGVYAEEKKWNDQAELSFVDMGGNSNVISLSAKNLVKIKFTEKLEGAWKLGAIYGESDDEKNAERYFTDMSVNYLFAERFYLGVIAGWLKDEFSGIDSRYYLGPSAGYKFLVGPKHLLVGEAGINYVNEKYIDDTDEDYGAGRAFSEYEYAFTEKNKFSESVEFLYDFDDSDNYNLNSETAMISALSDYLSLKVSYLIKYDNQPVLETLEKTDTILAVTLVANF